MKSVSSFSSIDALIDLDLQPPGKKGGAYLIAAIKVVAHMPNTSQKS